MTGDGKPASPGRNRLLKLGVFLVIISGLIVAASLLPVTDYLTRLLDWTDSLGPVGPVVVAAVYVVACVFMLPGSILTIGSGFLFDVVIGTITVSVGSTLGACAAFAVGRTFARDWVSGKVAGNARFAAIDEAVGRQGFKIVLLTRLSPLFPFNLLNYAYGLTKVKFRSYAMASWLGMLPGTVMYVYFGSAARAAVRELTDVAESGVETGLAGKAFFWAGLVVAVGVAVLVTRIARKALKRALESTHLPQTKESEDV